jgi:hypothetical protein
MLILMAFGVLVGGLIMRAGGAGAPREAYRTAIPAEAGARVTSAEIAGNRLVIRIEGAGANEVVVLDAASGRIIGHVVLETPAN